MIVTKVGNAPVRVRICVGKCVGESVLWKRVEKCAEPTHPQVDQILRYSSHGKRDRPPPDCNLGRADSIFEISKFFFRHRKKDGTLRGRTYGGGQVQCQNKIAHKSFCFCFLAWVIGLLDLFVGRVVLDAWLFFLICSYTRLRFTCSCTCLCACFTATSWMFSLKHMKCE